MADVESWIRTASDRTITRRAILISLLVGTILTAVNHGSEFLSDGLQPGHLLPIAITYLVPFVVSLASSVAATRAKEGAASPDASASRALPEQSPATGATSLFRERGQEMEQRERPP